MQGIIFREYCEAIYFILENGDYRWSKIDIPIRDCSTCKPAAILCPTHQMAMKFLREQKNIAILPEVHTHTNGFCWAVSIIDLNKPYDILKYFNTFDEYEDSIESALIYVCENVI